MMITTYRLEKLTERDNLQEELILLEPLLLFWGVEPGKRYNIAEQEDFTPRALGYWKTHNVVTSELEEIEIELKRLWDKENPKPLTLPKVKYAKLARLHEKAQRNQLIGA